MKSIFSIVIFVFLAVFFSQPEKKNSNYIPLSISFDKDTNNSNQSKLVKVKFLPNNEDKTYNIKFDKQLHSEIRNLNFKFNYSDCKITRRPQLGINCTKNKSKNVIYNIILHPIYSLGQSEINDYLLVISYKNSMGMNKKLKYLFDTSNLHMGSLNNDLKISKNN